MCRKSMQNTISVSGGCGGCLEIENGIIYDAFGWKTLRNVEHPSGFLEPVSINRRYRLCDERSVEGVSPLSPDNDSS